MDPVQRLTVADNKTGLDLKSRNILKVDPVGSASRVNVECTKKREKTSMPPKFSV